MLNYLGQGALLLAKPEALENPFYLLAPDWALYPMVVLSACATVIASQAVISGAFSMTRQAVQLGYLPRLPDPPHLGGRDRPDLRAARQSVPAGGGDRAGAGLPQLGQSRRRLRHRRHRHHVAHHRPGVRLHRRRARVESGRARRCCSAFSCSSICCSSAPICSRFVEGGWFPLAVAAFIFVVMATWMKGRDLLARARARGRHAAWTLPQEPSSPAIPSACPARRSS